MLRKFVESSNLISKQITIEYPQSVPVCVCHNLCVRPKVGNAICTSCKRTQISRNLAMQIAQNSRRYIASRARAVEPNHDNIYKLYCEFSTTTARGEREGRGRWGSGTDKVQLELLICRSLRIVHCATITTTTTG